MTANTLMIDLSLLASKHMYFRINKLYSWALEVKGFVLIVIHEFFRFIREFYNMNADLCKIGTFRDGRLH